MAAKQCADGHCALIADEFPGVITLEDDLKKSNNNHDISKMMSRLKFTEGVFPIRMIIQLFLMEGDLIFYNREEIKHKWSVQMMRTLLERITYSQAEITLITVSEAIPLFGDRYKREMVTMALTIADRAIREIGTCNTDVRVDAYRKQCRSAKTLYEILNWWRPVVMDETSRDQMILRLLLGSLKNLSHQTRESFSHEGQHCLGKRWQFLWEKLVLIDSTDEGFHVPEVFAFPQRSSNLLSAEFNRMILYWKIRSQRFENDDMVHITIFHSSQVISPKPWIPEGAIHEDIGSTVIYIIKELTGLSLHTSQSSNSLLLKYARSSHKQHRDHSKKAHVTLESKYSIKDGELVRDCHWIVIPTTTEVLRTITISFHSNQRGMKLSIKFMRSKDNEAFINFHDDASTNYTRNESVFILDKVSKSFNYDNPKSKYVFRLSIKNVVNRKILKSGEQKFYISIILNEARCSLLDEHTNTWILDVCSMKSLTRTTMQCDCKRSTGVFSADIININDQIRTLDVQEFIGNMSLYEVSQEGMNPQIALLIVLWLSYMAAMVFATKRDFVYRDMFRTHIAKLHFNPDDKFLYLICFKTSALPQAGTSSRAWITLIGNLRQTAEILLDNQCGFERASECWFLVSCAYNLGDIVGVYVRLDDTEVDDNWRVNQVEVFDVDRDILFRFPNYTWLSQTNSSQLCANDSTPVSLILKLFSTFGEMIRKYHIILCFFLNIPGARSMADQITRLHCTFMWCQVATIILITGQPTHRFEGTPIEPKLSSVLTALPIVLVLNIIYIRLRMFLVPNEKWRLQWPHTKVPDPCIASFPHKPFNSKRSYKRFKMKAKLIQMLRRKMSIPENESRANSAFMPKLAMISDLAMLNMQKKEPAPAPKNPYVSNLPAVFGNRNQSAGKDGDVDALSDSVMQNSRGGRANSFLVRWMRTVVSGRGSVKSISSENDQSIRGPPGGGMTLMGGQKLRSLRPGMYGRWLVDRVSKIDMSVSEKEADKLLHPRLRCIFWRLRNNVQFDSTPIGIVIRRGWWKNDPLFGSTPVFGCGVHTFTTKKMKDDDLNEQIHRYKHNEESGTTREEVRAERGTILFYKLLGSNLMTFLICLNLGISTGFIGYSSYYFRWDEIELGMVYSSFVFAFIVFVVEPSILFLLAILNVVKSGASNARTWARKRASDVTEMMGRWNEVHKKNYIQRSRYFPASHYNGLGSINHSNMLNRLQSHDNTTALGGSERKYRGSLSLPVFLICVIVIMNVHGSVNSAFRQKNMIYKALGFTDEVEHKAPVTDEMWEFLERRYLDFFHARDGTFSLIKTRVFSKIRQVRAKPLNKGCSAPRMSNFTFPVYVCHGELSEHTVETRNWTRDWESIIAPGVVEHTDRIFKYTPPDVNSMLEYVGAEYPLGGYEYVLSATYADNSEMLRIMRFSNWIDDHTRAVIVEASVYDFNTGIATALVITYHFSADGIRIDYENQSFAFSFKLQYTLILLLAIFVLASLTLVELSTQYAKAASFGVINYMKDVENMMTVVSLLFYTFILVGFVLRYQLTSVKYSTLSRTIYGTDGALYLNMRDLGFMVFFLNGFSGFLAFTALMTIFQSAKNIPKLYIMLTMIRNVFILSTFPAIVIIMMAMGSHLLFQSKSYKMSTLKRAVYAVLQFVLDPKGLEVGYPMISNFFTVFQWGAFFVIIANGFQVALNEDYSVLVMETKKQGSKSMLASLTEMALASTGVINLEDPNTDQIADRMEDQKRQEEDDVKALKMFAHMSSGW